MTSGIARLRARATGPARLRAGLRHETRPVRAFADAFMGLKATRAAIPRGVLGGDVLDLLSARLRQALPGEEAPGLAPELIRPGRPRFGPAIVGAAAGTHFAPLGSVERPGEVRRYSERPVPNLTERSFPPLPGVGSGNDAGDPALPPTPPPTQPLPGLAVEPSESRPFSPGAPSRVQVPGRAGAPARTAVARALAEYWQLGAAAAEPARSRASGALPTGEAGRHGLQALAPQATGGAGRSWPALAGEEVADRIRAFAAGQDFAAPAGPTWEAVAYRPGERPEPRFGLSVRHGPSADGGPGSLNELSDRLADLLREQAIQHGIDVT